VIRSLYRSLLWLHPPAFRRQFAGEMLWIFDEAATAEGSGRFFLDGIVSLLRQWIVGCGAWKVFAAMCGGLLQILAVTPLATLVRAPERRISNLPLPQAISSYDLDFSRSLALLVIVLVLSTVGLCVAGRSRPRRG
jgi:hypothetical protein